MRVKSALWVSAYIRACMTRIVPAVVVRRGEESAGAIFIKVNRLDGSVRLLAPAPQSLTLDGDGTRYWIEAARGAALSEADADARLDKELAFDRDLWIVEIEDPQGRDFLEGCLLAGE